MKRIKRISYKKEPVLKVHRWIVNVGIQAKDCWRSKFYFCMNKKDVRELVANARPGAIIEIHKATHNFVEAWEK